jgi:hypothetical protein
MWMWPFGTLTNAIARASDRGASNAVKVLLVLAVVLLIAGIVSRLVAG